MKKILETAVSGTCVKNRVADVRRLYPDAYAEPNQEGSYSIVTLIKGAQETGVRAETISDSPPAP